MHSLFSNSISRRDDRDVEAAEALKTMSQTKMQFVSLQNNAHSKRWNASFPLKLLSILDFRAFEDILRWQPHGKSFVVLNPEALVEQTLKPYFGMNKLRAFERKLFCLGFIKRRDNEGMRTTEFRHKKFQRQNVDLCREMKPSSEFQMRLNNLPKDNSYSQQFNELNNDKPLTSGQMLRYLQRKSYLYNKAMTSWKQGKPLHQLHRLTSSKVLSSSHKINHDNLIRNALQDLTMRQAQFNKIESILPHRCNSAQQTVKVKSLYTKYHDSSS